MSLLEKIKADQLAARKARDTVAAPLLTTLIGEATKVSDEEYKKAQAAAEKVESPEDKAARIDLKTGEPTPISVTVEITDEKVIATLKKFLKNAEETEGHLHDAYDKAISSPSTAIESYAIAPKMSVATQEIAILKNYLPQQMDETQLRAAIAVFKAENADANMGSIMAHLKANYAGLYDGKMASQVAKG
jgi:uncharacterized protein YqeY